MVVGGGVCALLHHQKEQKQDLQLSGFGSFGLENIGNWIFWICFLKFLSFGFPFLLWIFIFVWLWILIFCSGFFWAFTISGCFLASILDVWRSSYDLTIFVHYVEWMLFFICCGVWTKSDDESKSKNVNGFCFLPDRCFPMRIGNLKEYI